MAKMTLPKVIAVELPTDRLADPFSGNLHPDMVEKALNLNYYGVVNEDGTWKHEPAAGWTVGRIGVGHYVVTHNLGYANLALSVNLLSQSGMIEVLEHSPTAFTVLTSQGVPTDFDWMFSLAKVISQPAQQESQLFLPF